MKILVTGGAGYLGSIFVDKLIKSGYEVRVLDSFIFKINPLVEHPNLELVKGDVQGFTDRYVEGCDAVVHLAALVFQKGEQLRNRVMSVNYEATKKIVDVCNEKRIRLLFPSSCSIYGVSEGLADENSSVNPVGVYAESKILAEEYIREYAKDYLVLRFSTAFGLSPRMRFDLIINEMTRDAIEKNKITVFNPEAWRPCLHVDDIAKALLLCLERDDIVGTFNVGHSSMNYQKKDLFKILQGYNPLLKQKTITTGDPRDYRVCSDKFVKKFGFKPKRSISYGISEIVKALKKGVFEDPYSKKYNNLEWYQGLFG